MREGGARLARVTRARITRSAAALSLGLGIASTGLVALAAPAQAAPPAPLLDSPASVTSTDPAPSISFHAAVGTPAFECATTPRGVVPTSWSLCASPHAVPDLGSDGDYDLSVREVSPGNDGDPAVVQYTLDTTAQLTVLAPPSPGTDTTPTWTISVEPGASATCAYDGGAPSPCAGTFTPPALTADGSYDLVVSATDTLGNTATAPASSYVLDTLAPAAPTVTGSSGTYSTTVVSWSWANPADDTALCTLTTPAGTDPESDCGSTTSFSTAAGTEGDYSLSVVLRDAAGNRSPAGTSPTYTLDTTAPTTPAVTTGPSGSGTAQAVTWTFTTPGTTTSCDLVGTASGTVDTADCSSGSYATTLPNDDSWTLTVTAGDGHGNTSSVTSAPYVLDTTGPSAATITAPTGLSNDTTPTLTWLGEMPSTGQCRWQRVAPTSADGPWVDCTARTYTPTLPVDGSYLFQVQLTDPLLNPGAVATTTTTFDLDSTPPAAPALSTPTTPANDSTPTVSWTPAAGDTAQCVVVSGATLPASPSWGACTSGTAFTPTLGSDGTWTLGVRLTDAAGNTGPGSSFTYDLDTTGPTPVVISGVTSPNKQLKPTFDLASDGDSTLTCRVLVGFPGGTVIGTPACSSNVTADLTGQADGTYTIEVTATDPVGNTAVTRQAYVLDTTKPVTPTVVGPTSPGNTANPSWTFAPQANTTAQCRLVQGISASAWSDCSSGSYTVPGIADGTYTVEVVVSDVAGNQADTGTSPAYTSDRTAPAAPAVTGPSGPGKVTAPSWTWTGEAGASATCRLDRNGVIGSSVPCSTGTFAPALTGDASYVVVVTLTDAAGNSSPDTTTPAYVLDTAAPVAPTVSGPTGTGATGTATWTWTTEAGATSSCALVVNGVAGTPAPCTSGTVVTLGADGSYAYAVTVTDTAGNTGPAGQSGSYLLDTTAPAAPSVTTPASPSQDRSPSFAFAVEAGATTQCRWRQGTTVVNDWAACTSPYTATLAAMPDADYQLDVRATDAAGNTGNPGTSLSYRLDTTAPAAPAVTMPAGPSTVTAPSITWTGEAGATASCVLSRGGAAQPASACSTPWTPTLSPDGSWTVAVTLTDAAGNTGPAGSAGPYVLDTTPPSAPTVTAPAGPASDLRPSWGATLTAGDTAECRTTSGATVVSDWQACTFPWVTDLTGQPDGSYTLEVRAVDQVGLMSTPASGSYVLDTTAPTAPVVTAPVSPAQGTSPVFTFAAEAGSSATCTVTRGATVVSPTAPCSSPSTVALGGQPDGTYVLSVAATDAAGNPGLAGSAAYVLDRTAPAAPVATATPASPSPVTSPTWSVSAEAGASLSCTVTGATHGAVFSGACSSPYTVALPGDDTYTLTVTATDAAGNTSPALTLMHVLDTTAPVTPTLTAPASPAQGTSPQWTVSAPEGTVECRLTDGGGAVLSDWASCGATYTATLTGPDGTYTLSARATDTAGNVSSTATSSYTLDRTAPAAPTVTAPASPSTNRSPTFTVSGSEAGLTATCTVSGASAASCSAPLGGAPFSADLSGAADGSYTLTVTVADAAGNTASATSAAYVLDTTAPASVLITAPVSPGSVKVVTWSLTGDADAKLECRLDAAAYAPCRGSAGTGSYTADLTAATDGTYTLTARARDAAGNTGPETSSAYVLDTLPPVAPTGLSYSARSPSNETNLVWSFGLEAKSTGLCQLLSATAIVTPEVACTSPHTTNLAALADGTYTLSVRAKDEAGNLGPPVSKDYVLDRTAPGPPTVTKTPGSPSPVQTPIWNVKRADAADQLECQLVGLAGSTWATCPDVVTFDLAPATSGSYTLQLRTRDGAGNVSPVVSAPVYVLDSNAPVPPDVSPPAVSPGNSKEPVFTIARGKGDTGDEVTLVCTVTRFDGLTSSATPCTFGESTVALTGVAPRTQGVVSLSVLGKDAAGNVSGASTASYLYDSVPPPPAQIRPLPSDAGTSPRVSWSFGSSQPSLVTSNAAESIRFRCQILRAGIAPSAAKSKACTSPHQELLTQVGTWALWVWSVDPAGNLGTPVSSRYTFTSPVPAVTDLRSPASGPGTRPTWTFTVPPGLTAYCLLSNAGDQVLAQGTCSSGRFTGDLSRQPHGSYTLTVQLISSRGDEGPYTRSTPYSYRAAGASRPVVVPVANPGPGGPAAPPTTIRPSDTPTPRVPVVPSKIAPGKKPTPAIAIPKPGAFITDGVPKAIGSTLGQVAQKPTIPLVLLAVVVGFLLLQNRIDRRDPKLASAPVGAEPELDFGPVQGFGPVPDPRTLGGGAPA